MEEDPNDVALFDWLWVIYVALGIVEVLTCAGEDLGLLVDGVLRFGFSDLPDFVLVSELVESLMKTDHSTKN